MAYKPKNIERKTQKYWRENDIKRKVREATEGNEPFFLIDGPPYLNGPPHVGHMQGKVLKDVMMRFKQMQGFDVWDQAGFDTHGLPNELATEEELGIEDKNEIGSKISAAEFIEKCRERATSAQDMWVGVMDDLAIWQDFENPYLTFHKDYIESEWWLVKQAEEQGLLYQALKPIHWCPRCQTSLSGYEVTDEYRKVEDTAIFVKIPLENRDEKLVIWTTTPWTIPANMAIFVHPDFDYARVKVEGETLVIADQLVDTVLQKAGYEEDEYEVLGSFDGIELQGKKYSHPLAGEVPKQEELTEEHGVHRVHTSEELVNLEEGTGLVHAATGHGQEDYEAAKKVDLPVFSPVDEEGRYTEEGGKYQGSYVHDSNEEIVQDIKSKGLLLHSQKFSHEYPHCWRCKTKLVYRAAEQWFIENEKVKQRMLEENKDVDWVPQSVGEKRFRNFVEKSPDWCISRQNYWGVPIPIWICDDCGEKEVVGSYEELEQHAGGLPEDFDPHKHIVDEISWECGCGGESNRIDDILDVWFDSGVAPFASLHYPFEEEPLESMWPMDFITEASDQIRGWFYSLMFCGILGFDEAPYEKILFQGHVLDSEGKKMSKSLGNVIDPVEQLEKFGADLPRFYTLRVAAPWEQTKYDEDEIENEIYRLFTVYWNTKEFFETYGGSVPKPEELEPVDMWMLSRLNSVIDKVKELMDNCYFHGVARELEDFMLNDLSRWYLKAVRSRIKSEDQAASWVLKEVIMQTTLLLAPIAPHITEQVYQDLGGKEESVHMERYPDVEQNFMNQDREYAMELVKDIVEKAVKLRDERQYNLRWPAKRMVISAGDEVKFNLTEFKPLIEEMANVKEVEFGEVSSRLVAKPDYSQIGPRFGEQADEVAQAIEELEHDEIEELLEAGEIVVEGFSIEEGDVSVKSETSENIGSKSFEKGEIFLDLHMDEDIRKEAFVAEVIRSVQQKRKEAGLEVEDRVDLSFSGDTGALEEARKKIENRIKVGELDFEGKDLAHSGEVEFKDMKAGFSFSKPV
ncbi:MAG: isoleucine--tRNA ligase [Candidatus Nanohaloarchaea archaeon]|nr:isoleucine--tRNA ligase [Candidatus Nanohaloarchaea archaeon]